MGAKAAIVALAALIVCFQISSVAGDIKPRIVNGIPAPEGLFPYLVSFQYVDKQWSFCGGTLIAPNYALTAAHCFDKAQVSDGYVVVYNTTYNQVREAPTIVRKVVGIFLDPLWNPDAISNDICIVELEPSPDSSTVPFATLALADEPTLVVGTNLTIAGYGLIATGDKPSNVLLMGEVRYSDQRRCNIRYGGILNFATQLCAGDTDQDTCNGDSGGPIQATWNDQYVQVGLTSFGTQQCNSPTASTVYSRIVGFTEFVCQTTNNLAGSSAANLAFCAQPDPSFDVEASPEQVVAGTPITCTWTGPTGGAKDGDFVGVFPNDGNVRQWIAFEALAAGALNGSWVYETPKNLPPGAYACRVEHVNETLDEVTLLASSQAVTVTAPPDTGNDTDRYVVVAAPPVIFAYGTMFCAWHTSDNSTVEGLTFIAVYRQTDNGHRFVTAYRLEEGTSEGEVAFVFKVKVTPGEYECRIIDRAPGTGLFTAAATSNPVIVVSGLPAASLSFNP